MIVGLVACGKAKRPTPCAAQDLYTGSLFVMQKRYVQKHCATWAILSAKHGLLDPKQVVAPYDTTLAGMSKAARDTWASRVRNQLTARYPGGVFVVTAGALYCTCLAGLPHHEPLKGLSMGRRMQALQL